MPYLDFFSNGFDGDGLGASPLTQLLHHLDTIDAKQKPVRLVVQPNYTSARDYR